MKRTRRSIIGGALLLGLSAAGLGVYSLFVPGENLPVPLPIQAAETKKALSSGQIDPQISRAYIYVGKTGLGHEHAVVGAVRSGSVKLGAAKDAGEIVFDMRTFNADTAEARRYIGLEGTTSASTRQQVNANMLGADVLNVARFSTATFKIASATKLSKASRSGKPQYQLDGKFTLHGVTQPLKLIAEVSEVQNKVHLRGSFAIFQTSFGITPYSKAFGAIGVANQLTIHGEIWLAK